ncbi:MAG: hypothetical protein IK002_11075 [Treponema sp.]|uniref:hypothetical protein n=1 Tax=Treponema sp. TaxID=166 RepID=UPI00298DE4BC|nr:hypothetical protein [Treponema sp.]MBR5934513.1 hypothetical protein [Treponema sp.]
MKRKYKFLIIILLILVVIGTCFLINRAFHPKKNLINERGGVEYIKILVNYGKPDIEYCSTGDGSFTAIYFIEGNISYMLIFDPSRKLKNSYMIKDGELEY